MCGSSQQAVHFAAQAVAAGDMDYAIGCGVENMTRVPMFLDISLGREGVHGFEALNPELFDKHELIHQGESAERIADKWGFSRRDVDEFAKESHRRAARAQQAGWNREILPTEGVSPEAQKITLTRDEGVRAQLDEQKIASLKPAFRPEGKGVVTAANSSQISDGASAVLVANAEVAKADGFKPRARFRARVVVGSDPMMQLTGVIPATELALKKAGLVGRGHRLVRDQRGLRGRAAGMGARPEDPDGEDQPLGRRHRARPSARCDRRRPDGEDARRPGSDRRAVRPAGDVHRSRPGDGDDDRAGLTRLPAAPRSRTVQALQAPSTLLSAVASASA